MKKLTEDTTTIVVQDAAPVLIEWIDAHHSSDEYAEGEQIEQGLRLQMVGFVVAETTQYITLAQEIGPVGARHCFTVPKYSIVSRKTLR